MVANAVGLGKRWHQYVALAEFLPEQVGQGGCNGSRRVVRYSYVPVLSCTYRLHPPVLRVDGYVCAARTYLLIFLFICHNPTQKKLNFAIFPNFE